MLIHVVQNFITWGGWNIEVIPLSVVAITFHEYDLRSLHTY